MPENRKKQAFPREFAKAIVFFAAGVLACWLMHQSKKPEDPWLSGGIIKVEREVVDENAQVVESKIVAIIAASASNPADEQWWLMPDSEGSLPLTLHDKHVLKLTLIEDAAIPETFEDVCPTLGGELEAGSEPHVVRTVQCGMLNEQLCPE